MTEIPIFDSLTHPMPNKNWISKSYDGKNSLDILKKSMKEENIKWAFAVGMGNKIGGYEENNYADFITKNTKNIFPVAFIDLKKIKSFDNTRLSKYFDKLIKKGYYGIKLHPRIGKFSYLDKEIPKIINIAAKKNLVILLCTYIWSEYGKKYYIGPDLMIELLKKIKKAKVILVHGGTVQLMQYIEICRCFLNTLLDLSFTLCKYRGSSMDLDIKFAFNQFDRRICIGSDAPEFSSKELRESFNLFSKLLSKDKLKNIAFKNIFNFVPMLKNISNE